MGAAKTPPVHLPVINSQPYQPKPPSYECSTCVIGPECPEYKEGYVCAFDKQFSSFGTREAGEVTDAVYEIVGLNMTRLRMAALQERTISGGAIDSNVTNLTNTVVAQLQMLSNLRRSEQSITVTASGGQARGVLSELFGMKSSVELNPPREQVVRGEPDVVVIEAKRSIPGE